MNKNKIIILLLFITGIIGFASQLQAANCGDTNYNGITDTDCDCGDTVIGAPGYTYQLTGDLTTCTDDGLIVGADSITIDGNNRTITGDGGGTDYGIDDSAGYDTIIIQNFANITNFGIGIFLSSCTGSTVQYVTVTDNNIGIYASSSSSNNFNHNTVSSNGSYSTNPSAGFYLPSCSSNVLDNNTVESNAMYGIYITNATSPNTLTNNTMSGNGGNLYVSGSTNDRFNNSIDTTNTVEGKPVYYLYNIQDTAETHQVYDGDILGDIGMFWCISCSYVDF